MHDHALLGVVTYSTTFFSNNFCFAFPEVSTCLLFLVFQFDNIKAKNVFEQAHLR